jgi:hypothetical protein
MAVPGRTTQLEAINTMLSAIGETPTTTDIITANSSADVVMAVQILDEVTKEVESQGWNFNTEYDVELVPDAVGVTAQGMVHSKNVGAGAEIHISDTTGYTHRFIYTVDGGVTTGDTVSDVTYVQISGITDWGALAAQLTLAVNHSSQTALAVTAHHLHSNNDLAWTFGQLPTTHPDYIKGSTVEGNALAQNILLTQDNAQFLFTSKIHLAHTEATDVAQAIETYDFGENGMRNGSGGDITLGTDVARVDIEAHNQGSLDPIMKYTGREFKLYDKKDKTFVFTKTVKATIIYYLNFYGLPQPAQRHITIRAARIFQDRMVGSQSHHAFNMQDEYRSLADLKEWEGDSADHTIFDNYDTYRTVNRGNSVR